MSKVIISAESTCDLSPELVKKYNIPICPGTVIMGNEAFSDDIDISPKDIFEYYDKTGNLAKTSAVNYQKYVNFFTPLVEGGNFVVHFSISSEMSSMYNNALLAAEDVGNVLVIDSRNLSTAIGLMVLQAAELAAAGESAESIYETAKSTITKVDSSFVIDTLTYLHKGGRCSAIAVLGANVLKLKPCIEVIDGKMIVAKKYRGKTSDVFMEYIKTKLADLESIDNRRCFVTHTTDLGSDNAKAVCEYIKGLGYFNEVLETTAGCTISAHCGPGTLGIMFIKK